MTATNPETTITTAINNADLSTLRRLWVALAREVSAVTGASIAGLRANAVYSHDPKFEQVTMTHRMVDYLRDALIVAIPTGRYEWNVNGFGDRVREQVCTHDRTAFYAALTRALA